MQPVANAGCSVPGIDAGDRIASNADNFEAIASAFLDTLERAFPAARHPAPARRIDAVVPPPFWLPIAGL